MIAERCRVLKLSKPPMCLDKGDNYSYIGEIVGRR